MLRLIIELADMAIFLLLAVMGILFIAQNSGGYVPFWGCAFLCTATYWKSYDKYRMVIALKEAFAGLRRKP